MLASAKKNRLATLRSADDFRYHLSLANSELLNREHSMYLIARAYETGQFGAGDVKDADYIVAGKKVPHQIGWNNHDEALYWYRRAAHEHHPWAQRQLGFLEKNPLDRHNWISWAAVSGDSGDDDLTFLRYGETY